MDFWKIILKLFTEGISPQLRLMLTGLVESWETIAKKTATPIDDVLVGILKTLLGI